MVATGFDPALVEQGLPSLTRIFHEKCAKGRNRRSGLCQSGSSGLGAASLALPAWAHAYPRAKGPWKTVLMLTRLAVAGLPRALPSGPSHRNQAPLGMGLPSLAHPPLPLHEFWPGPPSAVLQPPWPLHSFWPLQECLPSCESSSVWILIPAFPGTLAA